MLFIYFSAWVIYEMWFWNSDPFATCWRPFMMCWCFFSGDMVSPGLFTDHLNADNTVFIPHDSAEGYLYDFAVNLQTINYLQTLHLLQPTQLNQALEYMQAGRSAFSLAPSPPHQLPLNLLLELWGVIAVSSRMFASKVYCRFSLHRVFCVWYFSVGSSVCVHAGRWIVQDVSKSWLSLRVVSWRFML